jgi:hypothetical protein
MAAIDNKLKNNIVTMKDGRELDFGVRGKKKAEITHTDTGVKVQFDVINGDTHEVEFEVPYCENTPLLKEIFAYGLVQKVSDTGVKADDADDISLAIQQMIGQLKAGIWTQRTSGEALTRGMSDLIEAIRRIKGYAISSPEADSLKAAMLAKSEDEIKTYKANQTIKAIISDIQAEKAAARAAKLRDDSVKQAHEDLLADL